MRDADVQRAVLCDALRRHSAAVNDVGAEGLAELAAQSVEHPRQSVVCDLSRAYLRALDVIAAYGALDAVDGLTSSKTRTYPRKDIRWTACACGGS